MQQDAGLKLGQHGRGSEVSLCVSGALERGLGVHRMYFPCLCIKGGLLLSRVYSRKKKEDAL